VTISALQKRLEDLKLAEGDLEVVVTNSVDSFRGEPVQGISIKTAARIARGLFPPVMQFTDGPGTEKVLVFTHWGSRE
jgi:hypothetical protein